MPGSNTTKNKTRRKPARVAGSIFATIAVLARMLAIVAVATVAQEAPAAADLPGVDPAEHPPYECDGTAYVMTNGTYATVEPDPANPGSFLVIPVPVTTTIGNSLGYDPVTDYVYGTQTYSGIDHVEIYDAAGGLVSSVPLAAPWPHDASVYAGTVIGDGTYIVGSWGSDFDGNRNNLWEVDAQTGAVTHIGATRRAEADFSYNPLDGYLYHASRGQVTQWDPRTGDEVRIDIAGWDETSFGGSWMDASGNLYVYHNRTGDIFQISDPGGTPTVALVGAAIIAGGVDATSCVGEVDLIKDVVDAAGNPVPLADRNYRPGDTVTYAYTIINNAIPTGPQPLTVCDTLPTALRYTGGFGDPTGTAVFDPGFVPNATSMCVTVDVPSSLWTDPGTPGGSPVTFTIDALIPTTEFPGQFDNQAWLDTDGDRATKEILSDDPGDLSDPEDPTSIWVTGMLRVWKDTFGHPVDDGTDSFEITIECTDASGDPHDVLPGSIVVTGTTTPWPGATTNTFELSDQDQVDIWDIPAGTTCVLTEDNGTIYYTNSWSNDAGTVADSTVTTSVIDDRPRAETARFLNYTSTFTMTKETVVPDGPHPYDPFGDFDVLIECANGYSETHTISADTATATGASGTTVDPPLPLLPHATLCTATEVVPTGWDLSVVRARFTSNWNITHEVELTNTRQVADLTVTKAITGLPRGTDPTEFSFDITVTCSGGLTVDPYVLGPTAITPGTPMIIEDLPVGATCVVSEAAEDGFTPSYSPAGGKVAIGEDGAEVAITNSTGTFIITKTTSVDSEHPIDATGTFSFDIECASPTGAPVYAGTHDVTAASPVAGGATGGITYDELPLLPPGTICVVTEQTPVGPWTQTPNNDPVKIEIDPAEPVTAAFTNERDVADLTVTKTVVGAPPGMDLDAVAFDVTVSCTGGFASGSDPYEIAGQVSGATDLVIEDLPVDATCVVSEAANPAYATSYGADGGKVAIEEGAEVAITNTTTWFTLTKTTKGTDTHPLDLDGTFTLDVECQASDGTVTFTGSFPLTTSDQTATVGPPTTPLLAPDTTCVVTETPPAGWQVATDDPQKFEPTTDGTRTEVVNERLIAPLTITKTIEGLAAGADPTDFTFEVTVRCTGGFATNPYEIGPLDLVAGTPLVIADLPVGATCEVNETADDQFSATYSPASTVTITERGARVGITNSTGTFTITKTTTGPDTQDLDLSGTFTFSVVCDNGYTGTHTVTVASGSTTSSTSAPTPPLLAADTRCTITEQTPPTGWALASTNPVVVDIVSDPDATPDAAFTNRRDTADLTIAKTLVGIPAGADLGDEAFTVDVSCTGDFDTSPLVIADVAITANTPAVIADLPTGAVCSVVEDADTRFTTSYAPENAAGDAGVATIATGGSGVEVINATGEIIVLKNTVVDPDHPIEWEETFEFRIVCTSPGGATVLDTVETLTTSNATSTGGTGSIGYADLPLLPAGSICTVTEQNLPADWTLATANDVELTVAADDAQTAAFTNERDVVDLTITKTVDGLPAGIDATGFTFTVDITCTGPFRPSPYVIVGQSIAVGTDLVIENLPAGAACSVVEDADPRFTTTYSPPTGSVTLATGDDNQVDVTNATGTIGIVKETEFDGSQPIDTEATFTFRVRCDNGYDTIHSITTNLADGTGNVETPALPLLPAGTDCTITEQNPPTGWTAVGATSADVTVATSGEVTATFTNNRDTADFTVTKTLLGVPAGEDLDAENFVVDVSCIGDFDTSPLVLADQLVSVNTPLVIADLPTGAVCSVVEDPDPRFSTSYNPATAQASITDIGGEVDVINATGELIVAKWTEFDSTHPIEVTDTFTFDITCTSPGGASVYSATHDLTVASVTADSAFGSLRYDELPLMPDGTACTVSETGIPTGWTLDTANDLAVTINNDAPVTAEFTNSRDTGDLTISKSLVGVPPGFDLEAETFTVDVSCTGGFTAANDPYVLNDLVVTGATDVVISDLPTGAVCTVVEDADTRFTPSYLPADGTVTIDTDGAEVAITNSTGEFIVAKWTEFDSTHPIDPTDTFTFDISCTSPGGSTVYDETHTITASTLNTTGAFGSIRYDELPILADGSTCTITETAVPTGWTLASAATVTIDISSVAPATAEFTNTRDTADLTVVKTLDGVPTNIDLSAEPFTVDVSCTGGFTAANDPYLLNDLVVTDASDLTIANLPTGAVCTISEDPDPRFAVTYAPAAADGLSAEVTIADGVVATLTNTTSTFSLSKETSADTTAPVDIDATFTVAVVCTGPDGSTQFDDDLTLTTVNGAVTLVAPTTPLVLPGSDCSFTETGIPTGWSLTSAAVQNAVTNPGGPIEITISNERDVADLTVAKVLAGVPADFDLSTEAFAVDISCTGNFDTNPYTVSATVTAATNLVVPDLPTGAVCTIVETVDPRFTTSYSPANASGTEATVTIADDGAAATITNSTGSLGIEKLTEVAGVFPINLVETFTFSVECNNGYSASHTVTTNSPTPGTGTVVTPSPPLLPSGTTCEITEATPPTGWTLASAESVEVTISDTGEVTGQFTNSRDTGSLTVTKTVLGVPDGFDFDTLEFEVAITCIGGFDDANDPFDVPGPLTVSVANDLVVGDLPTGAECTVVETPDPRFEPTANPSDGTVTITADDSAQVDLTNASGELIISKTTLAPQQHPLDAMGTFEFRVECNNNPTPYVADVSVDVNVASADGAWGGLRYDQLPLLPEGTSCDITETGGPAGWTLASDETVTVTITSAGAQTAAFTNTRDNTELVVTKTLAGVGSAVDLDSEAFDVTISCSGGFTTETHVIDATVSVDTPLTITELPTLSTCTVTEDADPRFSTSYAPDIGDGTAGAVTLDDDGELVEITNSTSTISITKATTIDSSHPTITDATFTYTVVCTGADATVLFDDTIDITTVDGTGTWQTPATPLVPPGTSCVITETPATGWTITSRTGGEPVGEAGLAVTTELGANDTDFTNDRTTGDLTITKDFLGLPDSADLSLELFDVTVNCTGELTEDPYEVPGPLTVSAAEPLVIENLPTGSLCTVVEAADDRFAPIYEPADGTVEITDEGATTQITNSTGHLVLVKNTAAQSDLPVDLSGTFRFSIVCSNGYSGEHDVPVATPTADGMTGILGSEQLPILAAGTTCDITEIDQPEGWTLTSPETVTITITDVPAAATFNNERDTASLELTKELAGVPADRDLADVAFDLTVACAGDFVDGSHELATTVSVNTPATVTGLPTGATCDITEAADDRFTSSYEPARADAGAAQVVIGSDGASAAVTNTTGTITLTKLTSSSSSFDLALDGDFTFAVTCRSLSGGVIFDDTITITVVDGQGSWNDVTTPLLALGSVCSVDEETDSDWSVGSVTGGSDATDAELSTSDVVIVVEAGANPATIENVRTLTTLALTKTIQDLPEDVNVDTSFDVTVTCSGDFAGGTTTLEREISVDETITIDGLPTGSTCQIIEIVEASLWQTNATEAEPISIELGLEANLVTVENTYVGRLQVGGGGRLAFTGDSIAELLRVGALLLAAGGVLILIARRRRLNY